MFFFYPAQWLDLFAWCVRLSRLLVGFRTHLKSVQFQDRTYPALDISTGLCILWRRFAVRNRRFDRSSGPVFPGRNSRPILSKTGYRTVPNFVRTRIFYRHYGLRFHIRYSLSKLQHLKAEFRPNLSFFDTMLN